MVEEIKVKKHKSFLFLTCCLILGLILNLFLLKHVPIGPDGYYRMIVIKDLFSGKGYGGLIKTSPFHPLLMCIFYMFIGNLETAGHLVSITSFLISIILFFKLARLIYSDRVAYLASILFLTHTLILEFSPQIHSHSTDILLIIITIYLASLIIKNDKLKYRNFVLLGIVLACAILNRPENIILSLAIIPTIFIQKKGSLIAKVVASTYLIIVLIVLVFPYANFLHRHTGRWTLTTKIKHLQFYEYMGSSDPLAREKQIQKMIKFSAFRPFEYIRNNEMELLKRYRGGIRLSVIQLGAILYTGWGYILIVLGLFGRSWDRNRKKVEILLFSCLAPLLIIPLGNVKERYFLSTLPIFLLWIAKGLENLYIFIKDSFNLSDRESNLEICLVLILLISIPLVKLLIIPPMAQYKQMGLWMKNNIEDVGKKKVACTEGELCTIFYSGSIDVLTPFEENYGNFIESLKSKRVDYLIISGETIKLRPYLKFLLNDREKYQGLIKVHVIERPKKIILYKSDYAHP